MLYVYSLTLWYDSNVCDNEASKTRILKFSNSFFSKLLQWLIEHYRTGQCKRTGGCYNELVVAFYSTGGGVNGKKIYTC